MPGIAKGEGAIALLSINVQDFGAKEQYFRALVAAGVSVVVLRIRSSDKPDVEHVISTITRHIRRLMRILGNAEEALVISVDKSNVRPASLRQILKGMGM